MHHFVKITSNIKIFVQQICVYIYIYISLFSFRCCFNNNVSVCILVALCMWIHSSCVRLVHVDAFESLFSCSAVRPLLVLILFIFSWTDDQYFGAISWCQWKFVQYSPLRYDVLQHFLEHQTGFGAVSHFSARSICSVFVRGQYFGLVLCCIDNDIVYGDSYSIVALYCTVQYVVWCKFCNIPVCQFSHLM